MRGRMQSRGVWLPWYPDKNNATVNVKLYSQTHWWGRRLPSSFHHSSVFFFLVWAMSSFDSPMADTALYGAPTVKVAPAPRAALWGQPITDAWVNSKGLLWNNAKHEKLSAAQWSTLDYRGTDACWGKPASVLGLAGWHTWSRGWLCWLFVNAATCSLKGYSGVSLIYSLTHRDTE